MKTINYKIAEHYLPALINGDYTGMSAEDEYLLEQFIDHEGLPAGHWSYEDDEAEFANCDVCRLMANCIDATYVVMS